MLKEFKEFAMKGNIMDLAIGVVIGGAFQAIVNSLVKDMIMPTISILTGKVDFSDMVLTVGNAEIKYGNFITTIINFLIIAFSIFLVVRYLNKLNRIKELGEKAAEKLEKLDKSGKVKKYRKNKKGEETVEKKDPETKLCPYCYSEINYKATKCPHCISVLETKVVNEKKEDIEVKRIIDLLYRKNQEFFCIQQG